MNISMQVIEALSWKLVSELHRRHPKKFTVIETHPGGGMYDCLCLYAVNESTSIASLNRAGSFQVHDEYNRNIPHEELWQASLSEDGIAKLLDQMSNVCDFTIPAKIPPTKPETLVYRIMASVSAALIFEKEPWSWRNGQFDSSGWCGQEDHDLWFKAFPGTEQALRADTHNQTMGKKYNYWFLIKDNKPTACLSKAGLHWDAEGNETDLARAFSQDRNIHRLVAMVLNKLK